MAWGAVLLLLAGCAGVGPQRLDADQMGYATALGEGLKRQLLLNLVRMRYADVPTFLSVSQLISGYTMQSTGQAGLNAYPNANPGNYVTITGTLEYTTRPTFTFTPVTGEQFAQSYLRPLAAAELLSLAQSGAPIDLLFRLGVQSVNGLPNDTSAGHGDTGASDGFRELIRGLRDIQAAGALALRFEAKGTTHRVFLQLDASGRHASAAARRAQQLLGIGPATRELEVVYGRGPAKPGQIAVLTRSVMLILYELGNQVDVTEADVASGRTLATGAGMDDSRARLLRVRQGPKAPEDAYAAVTYRDRWYWIEVGDFPSKSTFTFAYILQVLAESSRSHPAPLVTIPAQ
jgi:hypothetical protein